MLCLHILKVIEILKLVSFTKDICCIFFLVFYFILLDGGDVELDVDLPNVADSSNTASFGGTSEDGGFGLPIYDGDIGTLNDDYDF